MARFVIHGSHHDRRSHKDPAKYGAKHEALFQDLALALVRSRSDHEAIKDLVSGEGTFTRWFGSTLAGVDPERLILPVMLSEYATVGPRAHWDLLSGYLSGMFSNDPARWEREALSLLVKDELSTTATVAIARSGNSDGVLDRLCELYNSRSIGTEIFEGVWIYRSGYGPTPGRLLQFLRWCAGHRDVLIANLGQKRAQTWFLGGAEKLPFDCCIATSLALRVETLGDRSQESSDYAWSELVGAIIDAKSESVPQILRSVLDRMRDDDLAVRLSNSQANGAIIRLIRCDRRSAWREVAARLEQPDSHGRFRILHWLRPISFFGMGSRSGLLPLFEPEDILGWVSSHSDDRAEFLASALPETLDPAEGGDLTRSFLQRFGHMSEVTRAVWANGESRQGKASDHFRRKRDQMTKWLADEPSGPVRMFLEERVTSFNERIKQSEVEEERSAERR